MSLSPATENVHWPWWRKIIFRFFFIYIILTIAPWTWLDAVPGVYYVSMFWYHFIDWAVRASNDAFFHVRKVLVPTNGSGDTSWGWAQVWLLLSVAVIGCVIWSVMDRKRSNYRKLNYWLCLFTRYFIALIAFTYGFDKIFALQMPFPSDSQLATPLGDFLPMRFSWLFIGYSTPYQVFSGFMEAFVGFLLLYRRTATLGAMMATAVFLNVMMLNLCYDIPVKIFSMHLVMLSLFLLANEYDRIACFLILNRPAAACSVYHYTYPKRWMRIARVVLKICFIIIAVGMPYFTTRDYYKARYNQHEVKPMRTGVYNVAVYKINNDSIPALINDTIRWQDVIFDKGGMGSIKTSDTTFRKRYNRAYFSYSTDTTKHIIFFKKTPMDTANILTMRYEMPDSNTVRLWGKQRSDSLYILLTKSKRHFQLAEKQFHWLSEYNR